MARIDRPPLVGALRAALRDKRAAAIRLDQYYTRKEVAAYLYAIFREHFDPNDFLMVEPSAGTGSFFTLLPRRRLGCDLDPKCAGVKRADFLKVWIKSNRKIAAIGNPPFGKNASTAIRFFNHAAAQSEVIAFILPLTFRKASIQNRLSEEFHLIYEEELPENAFLFCLKPYHVRTIFQIWERRPVARILHKLDTRHPDFEFTTADLADFAIQRVGAQAGKVHRDFAASPSSHYFIRGNVEAIMAQLDFAKAASNVAGNPSLAKSEIVSLYRAFRAQESHSNFGSPVDGKTPC